MRLVIAEKPSVAQSIAKVLGADERKDGYMEGNGSIVSWCVGRSIPSSHRAWNRVGLRSSRNFQ